MKTCDLFPPSCTSSSEQNTSHTYTAGGTYTATLTVTDNGGATGSAQATVTVAPDITPPGGTVSINGGASLTNSASVMLTLSAIDGESGMGPGAEMQFSNDNVTWSAPEAYAASKTWTLNSGDGTKAVYVKFKDAAANWMATPAADSIVLDTMPPARPTGVNVVPR